MEKSSVFITSPHKVLKFENFEKIKEFILKQGKKQTYCNMYNDNPYWKFTNFHLYLNPNNPPFLNNKTDYFSMTFQVLRKAETTFYLEVLLHSHLKQLEIVQKYEKMADEELINKASLFFMEALGEIDKFKN